MNCKIMPSPFSFCIIVEKPRIQLLSQQCQERSTRLPRYEERVNKLERYVNQMVANITKQQTAVTKVHEQLKGVIRSSIQQLVEYIFPILPVQPMPRFVISKSLRLVKNEISSSIHQLVEYILPILPVKSM